MAFEICMRTDEQTYSSQYLALLQGWSIAHAQHCNSVNQQSKSKSLDWYRRYLCCKTLKSALLFYFSLTFTPKIIKTCSCM